MRNIRTVTLRVLDSAITSDPEYKVIQTENILDPLPGAILPKKKVEALLCDHRIDKVTIKEPKD